MRCGITCGARLSGAAARDTPPGAKEHDLVVTDVHPNHPRGCNPARQHHRRSTEYAHETRHHLHANASSLMGVQETRHHLHANARLDCQFNPACNAFPVE
jgi:hypothetical protein